MNNIKSIIDKKVAGCAAALMLMLPGCRFDEEVHSLYTPEIFYASNAAVMFSFQV